MEIANPHANEDILDSHTKPRIVFKDCCFMSLFSFSLPFHSMK